MPPEAPLPFLSPAAAEVAPTLPLPSVPALPPDLGALIASGMPGITPWHLALGLVSAASLGAMMAWAYKRFAGDTYDPDIAQSQILLASIMALVLMVVGDSVSRAFGAVGILSVIRFRANVKNSAEAATLLSAVAVGMACGVGMYVVALVGAVFLCVIQALLRRTFGQPPMPVGQAAGDGGGKKKKKKKKGATEELATGPLPEGATAVVPAASAVDTSPLSPTP